MKASQRPANPAIRSHLELRFAAVCRHKNHLELFALLPQSLVYFCQDWGEAAAWGAPELDMGRWAPERAALIGIRGQTRLHMFECTKSFDSDAPKITTTTDQ